MSRERRVVEDVGDERQEPVADPVQEEHVAALAGEARAVDDLRLARGAPGEQLRPVLGVVLEVGVLDQHEVAGDVLEPGADRRALALVALVRDTRTVLSRAGASTSLGAVGAPVVDDHDLEVDRQLDRAHPAHDLDHGVALVVDRHDHRELPEPCRVVQLAATVPPVPVVGAGETLAELDLRMPAEHLLGERDVGSALRGVVDGQRLERQLRRSQPVTSSTSSASSRMVNSFGLPMFIGPTWSESSNAEEPADLVVHVAERPRLLAVAVDGERLAPHRLDEEVRHHPPVGRSQSEGRRC